VESTQTIEPESPPCPACHRGVLRREVEPDPSLRSASRFSARESAVLASLAVQYVFSPGLLDDVEKLSSHATCAATRHARPAPSVMVRRTSALDAGQSRTNWKRRAYFWASSENGPRQTPKTPLFGLFRGTAEPWPINAVVQFFVMMRGIGCIGILCCTAAKSHVQPSPASAAGLRNTNVENSPH
jgi:hypothetical protein